MPVHFEMYDHTERSMPSFFEFEYFHDLISVLNLSYHMK